MMKLFSAFIFSFIASLIVGGLIFLGIPLIWSILDNRMLFFSLKEGIPLILYIIYGVIQISLSITNLIQVHFLDSQSKLCFDDGRIYRNFFMAELFLYLFIFSGLMAIIRDIDAVPIILAFSTPYIICCTASVFFFHYFLKLPYKPETKYGSENDN